MNQPSYACAIIKNPEGLFLFEQRDHTAAHAAGLATCFGGKREAYESAAACLVRELFEELHWQLTPQVLRPAVDLWDHDVWVARFYSSPTWPTNLDATACEPGRSAVWLPATALTGMSVSPWHRAALQAWQTGSTRAEIPPHESPRCR